MIFLCNIDNLKLIFDFIVLSEIWGNSDMAKLNIIEGYNIMYMTSVKNATVACNLSINIDLRIAFKKRLDLQLLLSRYQC